MLTKANNTIKPKVATHLYEKYSHYTLRGVQTALEPMYLATNTMKSFRFRLGKTEHIVYNPNIARIIEEVGEWRLAQHQGPCEFQVACPPHKWMMASVTCWVTNIILLRARNVWNGEEWLEAILDNTPVQELRVISLNGYNYC